MLYKYLSMFRAGSLYFIVLTCERMDYFTFIEATVLYIDLASQSNLNLDKPPSWILVIEHFCDIKDEFYTLIATWPPNLVWIVWIVQN